nr:spore germination protein [Clostridium ljungdahlii]
MLLYLRQWAIPTPLTTSISAARQGIPFPTTVEAVGLLITFEILRKTGVRMPNQIGQAFSIMSALVLGEAAVDLCYIGSEIREEMYMIISNRATAKEILQSKTITSNLKCFDNVIYNVICFISVYNYIFYYI